MPKTPLIALKQMTYMTRRLQAGDAFLARSGEAKILKKEGRARDDYDAPVKAALAQRVVPAALAPAAKEPEEPEPDPLDALRAEARSLGLHVDGRWGETRLMQEIDDAREKAAQKATESHDAVPSADAEKPPEQPSGLAQAVAMTTESASSLMPHPWRHDEE